MLIIDCPRRFSGVHIFICCYFHFYYGRCILGCTTSPNFGRQRDQKMTVSFRPIADSNGLALASAWRSDDAREATILARYAREPSRIGGRPNGKRRARRSHPTRSGCVPDMPRVLQEGRLGKSSALVSFSDPLRTRGFIIAFYGLGLLATLYSLWTINHLPLLRMSDI